MVNIIKKTKEHFLYNFDKERLNAYPFLPRHIENVEKWANKLLEKYSKADKDMVLLSVWLHDIGQTLGNRNEDHAIKSETEARHFLNLLGYPKEKIDEVAHCVRAHRCKDVQPKTLEAKILAGADSASHFTDINYIVHLTDNTKADDSKDFGRNYVEAKIERDFRDINILPGLRKELTPIYKAWKKLIRVFPNIV